MKLYLFLFIFYSNVLYSQSTIYDLAVTTASGANISLAEFKGRKILIASVSPTSLQEKGTLSYWDSLQIANPKTIFILVPTNDFDMAAGPVELENIKNNISDNLVLSEGMLVKKDKGKNQDPIMQWLTDSGKNLHFNADVETDVQIYLISESGVLYSVLNKGVPGQVLNNVLNQPEVKEQNIILANTKQ